MEHITFDNDITVFYVTAESFPEGISDAHNALHERVPFSTNRKFFGISRPETDVIVYRAAAEELRAGEAKELDLDTVVLRKGKYLCLTVNDYTHDKQGIDSAFKRLLAFPGLDPKGYCVEWYFNETDVKCMVRLT